MCGIAGIHLKNPSAVTLGQLERFTNAALLGIEPRGQDAAGFVAMTADGRHVVMDKKDLAARWFIQERRALPENTRTVLMHTRYATQGLPEHNENNHPVLYRTCFVTHNGHISNDSTLFQQYNLDRHAEVDSEAIPALLSEVGLENASEALEQLYGGFAIAAIDPVAAPGKLLLAKGRTSPLIYFENDNLLAWASTKEALLVAWKYSLGTPPKERKLRVCSDGDMMLVQGNEVERRTFTLKSYVSESSYTDWRSSTTLNPSASSNSSLCTCGHTRFWHHNRDMSGECLRSEEAATGKKSDREVCDCKAFTEVTSCDVSDFYKDLVQCTECLDHYSPNSIAFEHAGVAMCNGCIAWEDDKGENPMHRPDNEDEAEIVDAQPAITKAPDSDLHFRTLVKVSATYGYPNAFVEWLLFDANPRWVDEDDTKFLYDLQAELDEAYADTEAELSSQGTGTAVVVRTVGEALATK